MSERESSEPSLDEALKHARQADRAGRIQWRDRIAAHGPEAIDAVAPWVADAELGAFAVRVIEATAKFGESDAAIATLGSVLRVAPTASIRGDVEAALARLQPFNSKPARVATDRTRLPEKAGWSWPGFKETDFGRVAGTTWRRRSDPGALVPLVLRPLLALDSNFRSYPIYMSPEVHIADADRYLQGGEWKQGWRASKLVLYAHGPTTERPDDVPLVAAGWYIEKGTGVDDYGPVEPTQWDWPRVLDLLRDKRRRAPLEAAMSAHGLLLGEYFHGRFADVNQTVRFVGASEQGTLVLRDEDGGATGNGWDALVERLEALPDTEWYDFHIWKEWPAEQAMTMGQPFAQREIVPVMTDLARVYLDVIHHIPRRDKA